MGERKRRRKSNLNFPWLIATTNSYRVSGEGGNLLPPVNLYSMGGGGKAKWLVDKSLLLNS